MNTLSKLRNGKNALRQLKNLAAAGALYPRDFQRLIAVAEEAFAEVIPDYTDQGRAVLDAHQVGSRGAFTVIDGGRP